MKDIINKINDLKIQRDDLIKQFEKAMNDKDISVAIAIKIKQDSISNEIMKCYDRMIELQITKTLRMELVPSYRGNRKIVIFYFTKKGI